MPVLPAPVSETLIPLVDLRAQYCAIKTEVDAAVHAVLERGDFILGSDVQAFEREFAAFCRAKHAVSCGSGTEALHLGLKALGIGPQDEVIMPAMTFISTALAISLCGARPALVDVDPQTALIDPDAVERAITPRTRAIVPVHLFGQCADVAAINAIARRYRLHVIEDAAQAHGARAKDGRYAGTLGDLGCFSFYPGKNLGAYGDGGLITTNDSALAGKLELLRNCGSRRKYHHELMGTNSRLDTIQAAVLRVKLKYLEAWNQARRRHAAAYDAALAPLNDIELTRYDSGAVYHLYVIRSADRDDAIAALKDAGIDAAIHYPFAVHQHAAYAWLGYRSGTFPVAEAWARRCLSLPIFPELPETVPVRAAAALGALSAC